MTTSLVLASQSPFRRLLMQNAGLVFEAHPALIDERALEIPLQEKGASPADVALALAEAKAVEVSGHFPASLVIGSDQTLSLGSQVFHKPSDLVDAKNHLLALSAKTHQLNSAVVLVRERNVVWKHLSTARLSMRSLTEDFIDRYIARVGDRLLGSVGAYQLEGEGIQLFEKIEGDYFTILGLPMLPLLGQLRLLGVIDA